MTFGTGGHSELILETFPRSNLYGIDIDPRMIENGRLKFESYSDRVTFLNTDFANIGNFDIQ